LIPTRRQSPPLLRSRITSPASASRPIPSRLIPTLRRNLRAAESCGCPVTTLAAAPDKNKKDDAAAPPPASPAQQKMQTAVTQQDDLLAEFAKVSDQLSEILASLEASTFVKRFKAASKEQMKLATNIDQKTLDAFGIEDSPVKAAEPIAKQAKDQSEVVRVIRATWTPIFSGSRTRASRPPSMR
jgi:dGTP triphosphohydrolase